MKKIRLFINNNKYSQLIKIVIMVFSIIIGMLPFLFLILYSDYSIEILNNKILNGNQTLFTLVSLYAVLLIIFFDFIENLLNEKED